jgi:hypothetical protein
MNRPSGIAVASSLYLFHSFHIPYYTGMTPSVPAKRHQAIQALINVFDWYPSHYSPVERKLLRKLDCSLLVFASLSVSERSTKCCDVLIQRLPPVFL